MVAPILVGAALGGRAAAGITTTSGRVVAGSAKAITRQTTKASRQKSFSGVNRTRESSLLRRQAFKQAGKYEFDDSPNNAATDKASVYRNQLAAQNSISILRNRANRLAEQQGIEQQLENFSAGRQHPNRLIKGVKTLYNAYKTAKGLVRSAEIAPFLAYLYAAQALFAMLFFATYYLEKDWWFVSWVVPGELILGLSWVVIICIGFMSMFIAFFTYNTMLLKSVILVTGMICFIGYFAPYVFIIPWVFVWMLVINMTNIMSTVHAIRE
jgi:hypothetical protein